MAHVGVLKALEENGIPIDYITGSSIGAFIGAMYASGYSPEQIEELLTSPSFKRAAVGQIDDQFTYYFRRPSPNASWVSLRFSPDSNLLETFLPTSFISPVALDLKLMELLDPASAVANYNFDSLFVPFRCVAADIENKEEVVFREGNLNIAVRASMSYPLYLVPLKIDGKLLFDGGLYNNFPSDLMRDEFSPDVIIGSNVSANEDPPREDDFLSQLRNMVVSKTNYELEGDSSILIEPVVPYGTFDFNNIEENIDSGYVESMRHIGRIKQIVHRRIHSKRVDEARGVFNGQKVPLRFSQFEYEGINRSQEQYISRIIKKRKEEAVSLAEFEKRYFRLYENDKIKRVFPYSRLLESDSSYGLTMLVKREKNLVLDFGGNVASRPINTGYIGLGYNYLGKTGVKLYTNAYFGKLYASVQARARLDLPIQFPIYFEPIFTLNRWNYFKSRATFFEENNSLFLIQNERYGYLNTAISVTNKSRLVIGGGVASLKDDYYQTREFGQDDITDRTNMDIGTAYIKFDRNSLNDKLYPNRGTQFYIDLRYSEGEEIYTPGTTSQEGQILRKDHYWWRTKLKFDTYYKQNGFLRLGFYAEAVYSTQQIFTNYTSSLLREPAFQPTPESQTLFLESFRAFQYVGIGHKFIFNLINNVDLRLEGYIFQPYRYVVNDLNFASQQTETMIRENAERRYTIASANAVYKSPLGPVSFGLNYYHNVPEISVDDRTPLTFLFHFGYVIFNDRALE